MQFVSLSKRSAYHCGFVVAVVLSVVIPEAAPQQPETTMRDGVYSERQALRGAALYADYCRSCHGAQLTGTEFGPGITGAEFNARWQARSARELFEVIRATMPLNSPGGLGDQQNAELVAFILKRAGFSSWDIGLPRAR